jgi:hypothetical protein
VCRDTLPVWCAVLHPMARKAGAWADLSSSRLGAEARARATAHGPGRRPFTPPLPMRRAAPVAARSLSLPAPSDTGSGYNPDRARDACRSAGRLSLGAGTYTQPTDQNTPQHLGIGAGAIAQRRYRSLRPPVAIAAALAPAQPARVSQPWERSTLLAGGKGSRCSVEARASWARAETPASRAKERPLTPRRPDGGY